MAETEGQEISGQQGIFEPKPPMQAPESGMKKAWKLITVLAVLVLAGVIWALSRNPFMRPVKIFYKGLEREDYTAMAEAFPAWLRNADQGEGNITVSDMGAAILSATKMNLPTGDIQPSLRSRTAVEEAYLTQLEQGIESQYGQKVRISAGLRCTLSVQYRADSHTADAYDMTVYVRLYKINGRWVMLDVPSETP